MSTIEPPRNERIKKHLRTISHEGIVEEEITEHFEFAAESEFFIFFFSSDVLNTGRGLVRQHAKNGSFKTSGYSYPVHQDLLALIANGQYRKEPTTWVDVMEMDYS